MLRKLLKPSRDEVEKLSEKEHSLRLQGKYEDAQAIGDVIIGKFRNSSDPKVLQYVAEALVKKVGHYVRYARLDKENFPRETEFFNEAVETFDKIISHIEDKETRFQITLTKTECLKKLQLYDTAIELIDTVLSDRNNNGSWIWSEALSHKADCLMEQQKYDEALATIDQVSTHFFEKKPTSPVSFSQLFFSLKRKADYLAKLSRYDEGIFIYDDILARFLTDSDQKSREFALSALRGKEWLLEELGRSEAGITILDEVFSKFTGDSSKSSRYDKAIIVCDDIVARFARDSDPKLRAGAIDALDRKATLLLWIGNSNAEIATYDEIVSRFKEDSSKDVRDLAAKAAKSSESRKWSVENKDRLENFDKKEDTDQQQKKFNQTLFEFQVDKMDISTAINSLVLATDIDRNRLIQFLYENSNNNAIREQLVQIERTIPASLEMRTAAENVTSSPNAGKNSSTESEELERLRIVPDALKSQKYNKRSAAIDPDILKNARSIIGAYNRRRGELDLSDEDMETVRAARRIIRAHERHQKAKPN